ncbi:MAG: PspC domain-containing protein [Ruminococcus sp.]|jgi:phage shock protein PspC (stress-responsive transcriptional regulator)|nr:PspC domain-containing protein [Ruminococcus sp.]
MKKLTKSSSNKMICGVCAGLAVYLNIDPTLVRVLWAVGSLITAGALGLIAYIIMAVVIPYDNEVPPSDE